MKKLSIVVSVFNEEQGIELFSREINKILNKINWDYELIYVNDGSTDSSWDRLMKIAEEDEHVKLVCFSRNFGHEAAMIAGIDYSTGDGVVCMDSDLQHPVDLIPVIIEKFEAGYEVITMKRTQNKNAGLVKNITSAAFYKLMNVLSETSFEENASDFFVIAGNAASV